MCFSPQRRTIFRHLNAEKCSETLSFLAFWLQNVLFTTAACNFWFSLWPPDSAPAALTGLLLDWPETRIIEKTQHFATPLTFGADVSSFFWLSCYCIFFLLTCLLYSAFQLSILSEVSISTSFDDICVAMLEMKFQTALPRLVEQSFLGHLCLKHTDVSALNVSHILAQRGNFSRLRETLYCVGTSRAGIPP